MKNNKIRLKQRSSRKSLTLLFSILSFIILLVIVLVVGGLILILVETGILGKMTNSVLSGGAIVLMVGMSLIIGYGITYFLGRIMMKPINRIINAMNALASGNYKARLQFGSILDSNPTIKELTDSFNEMAEELDHTEILRSDFINSFSHEFKTPIVSISGFAKLLKSGNLTDEQRAEYTDIICEESLRLSDMATGVLNLTKIENQTILTNQTVYNLSEQLRSCILLLEEKWSKKNLEIDPDFDEYAICANEEWLKQVWINLLDNAIKFANESGTVSVRVKKEEKILYVSIANTGSSIPVEDRERIFIKFYQVDKSHASTGNGIGLAVVKKILTLHNGDITCTSNENTTTFTISLPVDYEK